MKRMKINYRNNPNESVDLDLDSLEINELRDLHRKIREKEIFGGPDAANKVIIVIWRKETELSFGDDIYEIKDLIMEINPKSSIQDLIDNKFAFNVAYVLRHQLEELITYEDKCHIVDNAIEYILNNVEFLRPVSTSRFECFLDENDPYGFTHVDLALNELGHFNELIKELKDSEGLIIKYFDKKYISDNYPFEFDEYTKRYPHPTQKGRFLDKEQVLIKMICSKFGYEMGIDYDDNHPISYPENRFKVVNQPNEKMKSDKDLEIELFKCGYYLTI